MKKIILILITFVMICSFAACSSSNDTKDTVNPTQNIPDTKPDETTPPFDDSSAVKIQLNGTTITAGEGVSVNGNIAVITAAGTYEVSGTLNDGQLLVDADECDVFLILKNANIHCNNSAPLNVKKADHVYLTLAEGSVNTLTDGSSYNLEAGTNEPDATLFSKSDMTISGTGTLNVTGNYNDAIANRDTLVIESGTINVNAVNHGIKGKDFLSVIGGTINITSGTDGIKSTNDVDSSLGYVTVSGGNIDINAQDEAISAVTYVKITGGNINIDTANNGIKAEKYIEISDGKITILTDDKGLVCPDERIGKNADVNVNGSKLKSNY